MTNCPIGGYKSVIPLLLIVGLGVLMICIDISHFCLLRDYMIKYQYVISTVYIMFMIHSWINLLGAYLLNTNNKPSMQIK